ncbi:MAG TPA: decaprenyl-phosphate phosphoribosyltransferase [Phycisphaerae bacterium]|nr:decaprenyl-phosphate phosphoribosyltransferase [Phycisphaerae bacterium]HRY67180.1 decaprenyl-phosphate phosphoribosyltransferase [Phycisphaerae bacterium]HSA26451.1 decaprenyl-phosphate phosphoribosyltransferase [Phycisphaerae bacterium]
MLTYVRLLRPADWVKNVFVFAALVFGNQMGNSRQVALSLAAFAAFCLAASAGYILNDILDRERDAHHPTKKNRPIASGAVKLPTAGVTMVVLLAAAAVISAFLPPQFRWVLGGYLALTMSYSLVLKHRMLLDVLVIAVLFVLRALAGACAIDVPVSFWLLVCTFMLCLFLGFGKRRCEIAMIGDSDDLIGHRPLLVRYTPDLLNNLLSTSGGIAIVTFLLYIKDHTPPLSTFDTRKEYLGFTLPLVIYGIFRYAMLIELGKVTGPTELFIRDKAFLATVILWGLATAAILYGSFGVF